MSRWLCVLLLICYFATAGAAAAGADPGVPGKEDFWQSVKLAITRNLGRPYVWGSAGLKSFDCSGFVWRVMQENGILIKRTTARKLYMSLPQASTHEPWNFGNLVFFNDLKHCGIIDSRSTFYHAESSMGTTRSNFDPYWRPKVVGVRRMPLPK